ncbi:hypothetical protein WL00_01475 [Burkholderia cepacia]|nr:hypothetical protein WL00_01475 [Burkholderia cepacia]KVX66873.1 hypothetical protein WL07_27200 [Burkholderia cepacia]
MYRSPARTAPGPATAVRRWPCESAQVGGGSASHHGSGRIAPTIDDDAAAHRARIGAVRRHTP